MALFEKELSNVLLYYKRILQKFNTAIDRSPSGTLLCQKGRKNTVYLHSYTENGKHFRKGINNDEAMIRALARKRFAQEAVKILEPDVKLLNDAINSIIAFDPDQIIRGMPKSYRNLPEYYFFDCDRLAIGLDLEGADEARIRRHKYWEDTDYHESTYHSENKKMRSSKGQYVRSKSELLIIESLYHYEIPAHYDEEIMIDGTVFVPDFTFEGSDGKPFFWEHMGMMNNDGYARHNLDKLSRYYNVGVVPGKNLILTFDENDTINMQMIDAIILNEVLPRL